MMMRTTPNAAAHAPCRQGPRRSFTLTELLVAIGIIAVIGGITAIGIRAVAADAKKSSATNTVVSALDNARALAIRENTLVAVVFRAKLDPQNRQFVEVVTARWTGESPTILAGGLQVVDRFVPVPGVASRRLPVGIKVAGPRYESGDSYDFEWTSQTHLPTQPTEIMGRLLGVLYAPDGRVVFRNAASDSDTFFVDFNTDGIQQISSCFACPGGEINYDNPPNNIDGEEFWYMRFQRQAEDEPLVTVVPFLAVFDDDAARAEGDPSSWNDIANYYLDVSGPGDPDANPPVPPGFITRNADRLHFNRYTGVVMR